MINTTRRKHSFFYHSSSSTCSCCSCCYCCKGGRNNKQRLTCWCFRCCWTRGCCRHRCIPLLNVVVEFTGSKSVELPDGNAALAWKRLKEKYAPILAPRKLELCWAFQISKLKNSDQDPEMWITYLEGLRMKLKDLGSMMTNEDLIVHILNNLTEDYEVQLSKLEEKLGSTTTVLMIDTVQSELQL